MGIRLSSWAAVCVFLSFMSPTICRGQISFQAAITLALINSPKLKVAQNDLAKANTNRALTKDIFIPSIVTSGGAGATTGITLTVPTIFTVNAQSLIFSYQQRELIRAARVEVQAANLELAEQRNEVQEDAAITYISLDEAEAAVAVLKNQYDYAEKLIHIDQDRASAGLESDLEVLKAQRGAVQIKLQELQTEDAVESLRSHLAELTGVTADKIVIDAQSIPPLPPIESLEQSKPSSVEDPAILAAEANVRAKELRARGDVEYAWRPLITFGAQYGRVSPINNVSQFYNLHGNYNTANVGFQIELPILDRVRTAAAKQSLEDAARARIDLDNIRSGEAEGLRKLERSIPELAARAEVSELDLRISQNELNSTTIQLHGVTGKPPLTPKEEVAVHIDERQKYLEQLDAKLQASKAEITFMRQTQQLSKWLESLEPKPANDK